MEKPVGESGGGQPRGGGMKFVARVQIRDAACQGEPLSEASRPCDTLSANVERLPQLRDQIGGLQQSDVATCPANAFADVEIPPPLTSQVELPELVFDDAAPVGGEGCPVDGSVEAEKVHSERLETSLQRPPAVSRHSAKWGERFQSKRWWMDVAWNASCVAAMLALALLVHQWLFTGGEKNDRLNASPAPVETVQAEIDAPLSPVIFDKEPGPVARITDLLPIGEGRSELSDMSGPLTDNGVEQVNFVEQK